MESPSIGKDGQADAQTLSTEPGDHGLCLGDCNDPDWARGSQHLSQESQHATSPSFPLEHGPCAEDESHATHARSLAQDIDLDIEEFERQMSTMGITPYSPATVVGVPGCASSVMEQTSTFSGRHTSNDGSRSLDVCVTCVHETYEKLDQPVDQTLVDKMRLALSDNIPAVPFSSTRVHESLCLASVGVSFFQTPQHMCVLKHCRNLTAAHVLPNIMSSFYSV